MTMLLEKTDMAERIKEVLTDLTASLETALAALKANGVDIIPEWKEALESGQALLNKPVPQTELITREEAMAMLGISSPQTIKAYAESGKLTPHKLGTGKRVFYAREEVEKLLNPT